jgi:hypothetical protein
MASLDPSKTYIDQLVNEHFNRIDIGKIASAWKPYLDEATEQLANEVAKAIDNAAIDAINGSTVETRQEPKNEDLFALKRAIKNVLEKHAN